MASPFSCFGQRLAAGSGIEILMDDLGQALARGGPPVHMLGGGNPAHIPAVEAVWRRRMAEIMAEEDAFERMLGNYDPPRGNPRFLASMAAFLRREFGWPVTPDHLAVTAGGQTAFFFLFNLLAGQTPAGQRKRIVFPLVPEYIGYACQGLAEGLFSARVPRIEFTAPHRFKYRVDFENLHVGDDTAAMCVSRPTNPTGNVLTDDEVRGLAATCREHGIPLLIDNAYGTPCPGILFRHAMPIWDENVILSLSLSKLGLPGTRTAVVVARPEIAAAVKSMTAVTGLANGNIGQAIVQPMLDSGEILSMSREVIQPYYRDKASHALRCVEEFFPDTMDYYVHEVEGALFLWLWFKDLPITSLQLYERLKKRHVLVVPGEFFFFGVPEDEPGARPAEPWAHRHECLRVSFAMDATTVHEGLRLIAEEAARAYGA